MQTLDALVRQAAAEAEMRPALAGRTVAPAASPASDEVARVLTICNACRYCEGFCAVFPAMTRRLAFSSADTHYLANLCHNCGACLHACQYAPPHEFAVNVPRAMARVRVQTYEAYAWPPALGALYRRQGLWLALALAASLSLFLALGAALHGSLWHAPVPGGDFYRVFPHNLMVALFAPVFVFAVLALGIGATRFWRGQSPGPIEAPAALEATRSALGLRYLGGGHGEGCNDEDDAFALQRRRLHHLTFYGFLLCFAATSAGTLYHYVLGEVAPYGYATLPKLFGVPGGVLLAIGTVGLWRLNRRRDPQHGDLAQRPMDRGFIALLFLAAVTGLLLTAFRGSAALALLLSVHLGVVLALFVTLPYGKFAHGVYRSAALLKWAVEKRQPNPLGLADD